MSDITLSAGIRQNLLTLQQTAALMGQTQTRLASGKKVNSALDNPTNFFLSQGLSARASDLSALLDGISNGIQTIKAADKGITAITKLVKSAQSTARQAKQGGGQANAAEIQGSLSVNTAGRSESTTKQRVEAQTLSALDFANGDSITLTSTDESGTQQTLTYTIAASPSGPNQIAAGTTLSELADKINASDVANLTISDDGRLEFAGNGNETLTIDIIDADAAAATDYATDRTGATDTGIDTKKQGTNAGPSIFSNLGFDDLDDVAASGTKGATRVNFDADYNSTDGARLTITVEPGTVAADRSTLVSQYNEILNQIDKLASDASYNGINLIDSDSSELKIAYNERRDEGKAEQTISSRDLTSLGLNLAKSVTMSDAEADLRLDELSEALSTLRQTASTFGSYLTTVQVRKDFTQDMINTLQTGADNLVLADTNEEGANLLALQTRQSLATTALSLSSQADQSVLRLFG